MCATQKQLQEEIGALEREKAELKQLLETHRCHKPATPGFSYDIPPSSFAELFIKTEPETPSMKQEIDPFNWRRFLLAALRLFFRVDQAFLQICYHEWIYSNGFFYHCYVYAVKYSESFYWRRERRLKGRCDKTCDQDTWSRKRDCLMTVFYSEMMILPSLQFFFCLYCLSKNYHLKYCGVCRIYVFLTVWLIIC